MKIYMGRVASCLSAARQIFSGVGFFLNNWVLR